MRATYSTTLVLEALSHGYHYGFDIMDATNLPSGTVYPILRRLEREGMVTSQWEDSEVAQNEPRPQRRYYELTADGRKALRGRCGDIDARDVVGPVAFIDHGCGAPRRQRPDQPKRADALALELRPRPCRIFHGQPQDDR